VKPAPVKRVVCVLVLFCLAPSAGASGLVGARLSVSPSAALWDTPLEIVVSELAPHARGVLRAATVDSAGKRWVSSTSVRADGAGRVELRGDAAMRVLWSVHPPGAGPATYYAYDPPVGTERIRLTLDVGGRTVADTRVTRSLLAPGERARPLRPGGAGFYGEFFEPRGTRPAPGVLLFGGSEGGLAVTPEASLLAARGYPTLALAYFDEPGLPKDLARIPLEYFARALRWLAKQPGVDSTRLVAAGISRGSEAAQLLGVHYPRLVHAVVALVPSNTPGCGIPPYTFGKPGGGCLGPAWTVLGKAIPYSRFAAPYATPAIQDERVNGPVFLDCGGQDALWPSCLMAQAIVARLRSHGFRHTVTLLAYPSAGHGVGALLPFDPVHFPTGGTVEADQRARAAAWPRLLAFLGALRLPRRP